LAREGGARYDGAVATQAAIPGRWHPRLVAAAMAMNENRLDVA